MNLPANIQKSVSKYEPIQTGELKLYPVKVDLYDEFTMAKSALEVMHQSLPVALLRVPLLSAFYQMDYEAGKSGKPMTGLFSRALLGLALSLRLGEGKDIADRMGAFQVIVKRDNPAKLVRLQFTDSDGRKLTIEPSQYKELRQIIAAQNGVRLEDDRANPDIVKARKDMIAGGAKLDFSIDALISFAAAVCGVEESEIYQWPILKLTRRTDAYQTMLAYLVCGIGEASGATWKNGNPVPHPIFHRIDDGSGLASPMKSGANGKPSAQIKTNVQAIEAQLSASNNNQPIIH